MAEKEPRWAGDPPPGFKPDGTSMIAPPDEVRDTPEQIRVGDKLYTPEEFAALLLTDDDESTEDDDDLSDLDEIADL